MALITKKWLDLNPESPQRIGAETIPYGDKNVSVAQAIDALNAAGVRTEYITITADMLSAKKAALSAQCAAPERVVVGVACGLLQMYGVDFSVTTDAASAITWDGLGLDSKLTVGDKLIAVYEVAHQVIGTLNIESGGTGGGTAGGMPETVRVSADYTVTKSATVLVDTTNKEVFIQLPAVSSSKDITVLVKLLRGGNSVVIAPLGADMIDQENTELTIEELGASYTLVCDGQGWFLV